MKKILLILIAVWLGTAAGMSASAVKFTNETLRYNVSYKWGLIQKNSGTAVVKLSVNGNNATATLYARTDPWADKYYRLRDTLTSRISLVTMMPNEYKRIAHEGGYYARDIVRFSHSGSNVSASCSVERRGKEDTKTKLSTHNLSANGITVDLLSSFYYVRSLNFTNLKPGKINTINIFSGKKKELLNISYIGNEDLKIGKNTYKTIHLKLTFTTEGGKQSSTPIDVWVKDDAGRVPVKLEGQLKIGKIRCILAGA